MTDTFIQDLLDNSYKETKKQFKDIFKIEKIKIGTQITVLTSVKIGDVELNLGKTVINEDLFIAGKSIMELQDKWLVGKTNVDNNLFDITSYED